MKQNIAAAFLKKIFFIGENKPFSITNHTKQAKVSDKTTQAVSPSIKPTVPTSLVDKLRTKIVQNAAFSYTFTTGDAATTPPGMKYSEHFDAANEIEYIKLSSGNPDALPSGSTGGFSIRLPDVIEAAASGHHIVVSIIARAAGNNQSRFALAYSTNEVGNSGWRWFNAGKEWSIHTMEFDVPVMKNGNSDFVGILVEREGQPGTEFYLLTIAIS